jgi:tetratricopeptide (TPR) repeat protein
VEGVLDGRLMGLGIAFQGRCLDPAAMRRWAEALCEREGDGLRAEGTPPGRMELRLHPGCEPIILELDADGAIDGWVGTGSGGPGYHARAVAALETLKQRFAPDLTIDDETGWYASRDRATLEEASRRWRVEAGRRALRAARMRRRPVLFGLPPGSRAPDTVGARVVTPMAVHDAGAWAQATDEVERGEHLERHFPWWNEERDAPYWRNLALAWLGRRAQPGLEEQQRRLTRIADAARRARELDPEIALPDARLAQVYEDLGRLGPAIGHLRAALDADPANHELRRWLVELLLRAGRRAEAATALEAMAERRPKDAAAACDAALMLLEVDEPARALAQLDRAVALHDRTARFHGERAVALAALGRYQEALRAIDRALELDPRSVSGWLNRAALLKALGRPVEAAEARARAAADAGPE